LQILSIQQQQMEANATFLIPNLAEPQVWISLLTLTFLEIVLGVDNIIFISIAANKLAEKDQAQARNVGMLLAMVFRIILLFGISYLIAMQEPLFQFDWGWVKAGFTGQSLILIAGGLFLLYKATSEIHHKLEGPGAIDDDMNQGAKIYSSLGQVIIQIALINIVFSFDSILTAVGLTNNLFIMIVSVIISILIMMSFAGPVGRFVNRHPTIQMLGLSFLILIGFMLIAEGAHLGDLQIAGSEIGTVPKGYLYFSIAFSLFVEALNMRLRKKAEPIQLHGYQEEAIKEGVVEK
jgi:predicted tellurium resistance membrane protein TerC